MTNWNLANRLGELYDKATMSGLSIPGDPAYLTEQWEKTAATKNLEALLVTHVSQIIDALLKCD